MRSFILFLFASLFLVSCGKSAAPALAQIDRITPETVEPGDVLRIYGAGFVEGSVDITLNGLFQASGQKQPARRKLTLEGIAVSETDIEVHLSAQTMKRLVREPVKFKGSVHVDFPVAAGAVRIFAEREDVRLEMDPGGAKIATYARKKRDVEAHLRAVGIQPVAAEEVDGIVAAEVIKGSAADKAGLTFGDRLLAVDDREISSLTDMADISPSKRHVFDIVTRQGVMKKISIGPALSGYLDKDELFAVILSSFALGFFLAFVSPFGRERRIPARPGTDPFTRAIGIGALSLLLCLIPAAALLLPGDLGVFLWIILFGIHAASVIFLYLKAPRQRILSLLKLGAVPILVVAAAVFSSAVSPAEIVAAQQNTTGGAHLPASPFSLLLGVAALCMMRPSVPENSGRFSKIASLTGAAAFSSVVTLCLLGGWNAPFISSLVASDSASASALFCVVFMAKAWLVLEGARRLTPDGTKERRASRKPSMSILPSLLLPIFGAATVLWQVLELPEEMRAASQVLGTGMLVALVAAILGRILKLAFRNNKNLKRKPSNDSPPPQYCEG